MGGLDKLDAELDGRSVLRWSIEALASAGVARMVVVTSPGRIAELAASAWLPDEVIAVVAGGPRRQESVAAGVAALAGAAAGEGSAEPRGPGQGIDDVEPGATDAAMGKPARGTIEAEPRGHEPGAAAAEHLPVVVATSDSDPVILVHDAARPLVGPALIRAVAVAAADHGAAIPILPVTETLKRLDGGLVGATIDRTDVVAAQTPQGVRRSLLEHAYAVCSPYGPETWTDEASLLEACRIPVHAITGEATNLKVTVPVDLERAQAMLDHGLVPGRRPRRSAASPGRVGLGTDSHPFGPGEPLVLGGVRFEGVPSLAGHSDGDVALHAVADALMGAAGLGDLGGLFPADSRTPRGIDSAVMLSDVAGKVRAAGWCPVNVDMTIVAARPKLGEALPKMVESIASILGLEPSAVNVKASTGNLAGSEGAGRSISASAIVWLVPLDAATGPDPAATRS
jgi:2-C-methyl-D-erythritol 4-phosphate cytidylyltransferase/2-C-methyl-D-erythritol 2,4-cyclodiphosphate synthase